MLKRTDYLTKNYGQPDGWTLAAEASWRRMYALIAEAMLEGAGEGLFNPSD